MDVQNFVEKPEIYILARCSDSIAEKLTYVDARLEDIEELKEAIAMKNGNYNGFYESLPCLNVYIVI